MKAGIIRYLRAHPDVTVGPICARIAVAGSAIYSSPDVGVAAAALRAAIA